MPKKSEYLAIIFTSLYIGIINVTLQRILTLKIGFNIKNELFWNTLFQTYGLYWSTFRAKTLSRLDILGFQIV